MRRSRRYAGKSNTDENTQPRDLLAAADQADRERLALIRGAIAKCDLQVRVARDLEALLLYLDRYSHNGCCRAFNETLAAHLRTPVRTLIRRLNRARSLGLIRTVRSYDRQGGGRSSDAKYVQWATIRKLALNPEKSGMAQCQTVMAPYQTGTQHKRNISTCIGTSIKPPPPSLDSDGNLLTAPGSPDWSAVEVELKQLGMMDSSACVELAKAKGLLPTLALEIIAHYRRHTDSSGVRAWGIGALHFRLRNGSPNQAAYEGWPEQSEEYLRKLRDESSQQIEQQRAAEISDRLAQLEMEREHRAQLEAEHGRQLDDLDDDALEQLGLSVYAQRWPALRRQGRNGITREFLLEALANFSNSKG